jgi:hypothetical protein
VETSYLSCVICILPILGLALFLGIVSIIFRDVQKNANNWRELARQACLTYNSPVWFLGRPTLTGSWNRRSIRLFTKSGGVPGMNFSRTAHVCIDMSLTLPEGASFALAERHLFEQKGKDIISTGDAEFDQRFIVSGRPPNLARQALAEAGLRRLLLEAHFLNLETADDQLHCQLLDANTDVEYTLFLMSLLFDLVEALERAQEG